MLTILVPCSFTCFLWPPCTWQIFVSTLGMFIRPQWSVVYPERFYNFFMQVNLACPLGRYYLSVSLIGSFNGITFQFPWLVHLTVLPFSFPDWFIWRYYLSVSLIGSFNDITSQFPWLVHLTVLPFSFPDWFIWRYYLSVSLIAVSLIGSFNDITSQFPWLVHLMVLPFRFPDSFI